MLNAETWFVKSGPAQPVWPVMCKRWIDDKSCSTASTVASAWLSSYLRLSWPWCNWPLHCHCSIVAMVMATLYWYCQWPCKPRIGSVLTSQVMQSVHLESLQVFNKVKSYQKVLNCLVNGYTWQNWSLYDGNLSIISINQSSNPSVRNRLQHDIHNQCFMWIFYFLCITRNCYQT